VANVVSEVTQSVTKSATPSILDQFVSLWWLWLLILIVLIVILVFIVRFVMKIKEDEDEIIKLFKERRKLCKTHRNKRYYRAFFRKSKNAKINCLWKDDTDKWHKKTVGFYYGDYYAKEGTLIIAFSKQRSAKWFILPDIGLLIINKKPEREIKYKDRDGKEQTRTQQIPTNIEEFMDDEIILRCISIDKLDREAKWFTPVLQDGKGKIINPTAYIFESFKDVYLGEYLLTNMNDALQQSKKALDMNQWIRGKNKLGDQSQSVDQPPNQG